MSEPRKAIDQLVLERATQAGAAGISTDEIAGLTVNDVNRAVGRLYARGLVFKGKIGHRTMRVFASISWAADYSSNRRPPEPVKVNGRRTRASWSADAPIYYPKNPDGSPAYKRTVIETVVRPEGAPIRTSNYIPY